MDRGARLGIGKPPRKSDASPCMECNTGQRGRTNQAGLLDVPPSVLANSNPGRVLLLVGTPRCDAGVAVLRAEAQRVLDLNRATTSTWNIASLALRSERDGLSSPSASAVQIFTRIPHPHLRCRRSGRRVPTCFPSSGICDETSAACRRQQGAHPHLQVRCASTRVRCLSVQGRYQVLAATGQRWHAKRHR